MHSEYIFTILCIYSFCAFKMPRNNITWYSKKKKSFLKNGYSSCGAENIQDEPGTVCCKRVRKLSKIIKVQSYYSPILLGIHPRETKTYVPIET